MPFPPEDNKDSARGSLASGSGQDQDMEGQVESAAPVAETEACAQTYAAGIPRVGETRVVPDDAEAGGCDDEPEEGDDEPDEDAEDDPGLAATPEAVISPEDGLDEGEEECNAWTGEPPRAEGDADACAGDGNEAPAGVNLEDPAFYINRELSQIKFNRRVLEQALPTSVFPLLERLNFLAIFHNNLDEFFMVRVSGILQQYRNGQAGSTPDATPPSRLLAEIRRQVLRDLDKAHERWREIRDLLCQNGIRIKKGLQITKFQKAFLDEFFQHEIYPVLTPQIVDPSHPFPTISNLSINFLVMLRCPDKSVRFARLRCPTNVPRFIFVPRTRTARKAADLGLGGTLRDTDVILLEDVVRMYLDRLFRGNKILSYGLFRITRNTDMELAEDEADDLLEAVRDMVDQRRFGDVVRLEVSRRMDGELVSFLTSHLKLKPFQVYKIRGPLAFSQMMSLCAVNRPSLKLAAHHPHMPSFCEGDIFANIREQDRLIYLPYESFNSVLEFIRRACADPQVVAIKQTLYRVGSNSPIVDELMKARRLGKQVTAVVELKARFDEERNITWAEDLEDAGVNVVYGLKGMKIHAKLCLVVRRENHSLRCYAHIGTGNYNPSTARIYTDLGLFTADQEICGEITDLFNTMTGYAVHDEFHHLLVAPVNIRSGLVWRIRREIENQRLHGSGHIVFKCNHIADEGMIKELYAASMAGVRVELQVRGICCLRPGIPGVSETMTVSSIVGRFLEHPRLYWFSNNGDEELFIGSADLMPRNLNRRIEVLTPVRDARLRSYLKNTILYMHFADNCQNNDLNVEGRYIKREPREGEELLNSQEELRSMYSGGRAKKGKTAK